MPIWVWHMTEVLNKTLKVTGRTQGVHRVYTAAVQQDGGHANA
jgi:hypothetical protein